MNPIATEKPKFIARASQQQMKLRFNLSINAWEVWTFRAGTNLSVWKWWTITKGEAEWCRYQLLVPVVAYNGVETKQIETTTKTQP